MIPSSRSRYEDKRGDPLDIASYQEYLRGDGDVNEERRKRILRNLPLAIEELSPRQRQILEMRFYQNMRVTDIAAELGITKSAVSRTLSRAINTLFRLLRYSL